MVESCEIINGITLAACILLDLNPVVLKVSQGAINLGQGQIRINRGRNFFRSVATLVASQHDVAHADPQSLDVRFAVKQTRCGYNVRIGNGHRHGHTSGADETSS